MRAKCLNPVDAWICGTVICKSDGVLSPHLVFSPKEAEHYYISRFGNSLGLKLLRENYSPMPCGKCAACQIRKRKDMTTRLTNECSLYEDKCCFVTLTYNDESVPVTDTVPIGDDTRVKLNSRGINESSKDFPLLTLLPSDVQKFIKRMRRHLEYLPKRAKNRVGRDYVPHPIRYFCVGEYGGKYGRPHYHLLIFGWMPSDLEFWQCRNGVNMFRSRQIEKLWKYGFSTVESVGAGCARYCSRYVTKKFARLGQSNPFKDAIIPEFCLQSIKDGGIGARWIDNYPEVFERGYVTIKSRDKYVKCPIPRYYWLRCRKFWPSFWLSLRDERIQFARSDCTVADIERLKNECAVYAHNERALAQQELF